MSNKLARHLSPIKFQLSSKRFNRHFSLFPLILHLIIRIIWLFVFLSCLIFLSICPAPPSCLVSLCVFIFPVMSWPLWPVFEVWLREDPKERLSLGLFGSLVRALASCSVRPLTFNRWNGIAWKDFCARYTHQSVWGFCLLNLNLSRSSLPLLSFHPPYIYARASPFRQHCQD